MRNNLYLFDKIVRDSVLSPLVSSDYHPSFSAENIRNIWTDCFYRSKYGSGSGWGYFRVDTGNQWVDFNEGGGELSAQIPAGNYDASSLCDAIKAAMELVGTLTYTVTYSDTSNKFTVASTATFSLLWASGSHLASSIGLDIGFDVGSDDTGASSYTGDFPRMHNYAGVIIESGDGSAVETSGCAVFGLNLTSAYQYFYLEKWTGSAWSKISDFSYSFTKKCGFVSYPATGATKYRIVMRDWTNTSGFSQVGVAVLGQVLELGRGFEFGSYEDLNDTSKKQYSKKGYLNIILGFEERLRYLVYELLEEDVNKLDTLWKAVLMRYPFVYVRDSSDVLSTIEYVIMASKVKKLPLDDYFQRVTLALERMR